MPSKNVLYAGSSLCSLLISVYLLRAVRDEMAVQTGTGSLGWLISLSFFLLILLSLVFSTIQQKNHRIYRGFILSLCLIYLTLALGYSEASIGPLLFIVIGSSNLLLVSQFWRGLQGFFLEKDTSKAYPQIMLIGSFGVLAGPLIVTQLASQTISVLLAISSVFLGISALLQTSVQKVIKSGLSPQLIESKSGKSKQWPIAGFILIYSTLATVLYGQHIATVEDHSLTQVERIEFFGRRDLWIGLITLVLQWLSQKLKHQQVRWTGFQLIPILTMAMLLAIGWHNSLETVLWSMILFRSFNYAYARPARELYFLSAGGRFNFKNFIDTVVYRAGDLFGIWLFQLLTGWQFNYLQIAGLLVPFIILWILLNKRIVNTLKASL